MGYVYIYMYGWIYIMGIQRGYNGWPKILELKTSHSFSWGGSPLIGKGSVDFDCTTGKNSKSQVPTTFLKLQHVQSWFVRISSANEDPTQINTTKIRALSILFIYILLSLYSLCSVLYLYIIILYMFVIFVCNSCLCIPYIYLYPYFCSCAKCGISWHISCISRGNQQTDFKKQKNIHIPTQSTLFLRFFQLISPSPTPIFHQKYGALFYKKHRGERQHPSWRIRRYLPSGLGRGDHLALRGGSKSMSTSNRRNAMGFDHRKSHGTMGKP